MTSKADLGEVFEEEGRFNIRFVRRLAFPVERVWAALTVPERIADWLGDGEVEALAGGRYHISCFRDDGGSATWIIQRIEPPRLLEIAFREPGTSTFETLETFELISDGAECVLTLTCRLRASHVDAMGGWHMFLDALPGAVTGVRAVWDEARHQRHQAVRALYRTKLAAPAAKVIAR
jgi:uncharacterized protein YndB with AHSA1/START domain